MLPSRTTSPSDALLVGLRDASVRHSGVVTLGGIDIDVSRGEMVAFAGPNGSGKSTLLGVLAGTQPHQGTRLVTAKAMSVAYVVQRSSLPDRLPLTVLDAVRMGRWSQRGTWRPLTRTDHAVVHDSLGSLGLLGLEGRPLRTLSGGQRQRVLIAQALAQRADLLLLDEPTAGLDGTAHSLIVLAIQREVARGAAVVHATHDSDVIRRADRVIRLESGHARVDPSHHASARVP